MALPDLACTITATGPDSKPITNGGSVSTASGGAYATVTFHLTNKGAAGSGPFWLKRVVRINGSKMYDPPAEQLTLKAHETKHFPFSKTFLSPTEDWKATILADIGDFVDETDETNNKATFAFTVHSAG